MHSRRLTFFSVAALVLVSSVVHAADYPQPIYQPEPQPIIIQQPAPAAFDCCDGWYLRGQVGIGMNNADYELRTSPLPPGARYVNQSISDSYFVGLGVGYNWNSWLRFEGTVDYRARTQFSALGRFPPPRRPSLPRPDRRLHEVVGVPRQRLRRSRHLELLHAICRRRHRHGVASDGGLQGRDAAHARRRQQRVRRRPRRVQVELRLGALCRRGLQRHQELQDRLHLPLHGSRLRARRSSIARGPCGQVFTHDFKNLSSHDFMVGFRWECCDLPAPPPPMVYTPPPPLRSKG